MVNIVVRDEGIGIPADEIDKLFTPIFAPPMLQVFPEQGWAVYC